MASVFLRNFAIQNNLTADYGYTFGWYKDFYISIKEGISYKILTIITKLGANKEKLKDVLKGLEKDLEKYCLTDNQFDDEYLQFTFNLSNDKVNLVVDFLDKFIENYLKHELKVETYCHICHKPILKDTEDISSVNLQGIIRPVHANCFESGKEKIKKTVTKKYEEINKGRSTWKGIIGAILFGIIFIGLLIGIYTLKEFLLSEYSEVGDKISYEGSATLLHYLPSLLGLATPFLIDAGYNLFKGTKGNKRYVIIIITTYVASLIGIWFGFTLSIYFLITNNYTYSELVPLIMQIFKTYPSFRNSFIVFTVLTLVFTTIGIVIKFAATKEVKEAEITTMDKLN